MQVLAQHIDLETGDNIPPGDRFTARAVEWDQGEVLERAYVRLKDPDRTLLVSPDPQAYQRAIICDDAGVELTRLVASKQCVMSLLPLPER